jgi:hypothetical protein
MVSLISLPNDATGGVLYSNNKQQAASNKQQARGPTTATKRSFKGKRKVGGGIGRRYKKKRNKEEELVAPKQVPMASAQKEQVAMASAQDEVTMASPASPISPIQVIEATALFGSPLRPSPVAGTSDTGKKVSVKRIHYQRKPLARCLQRSLLPSWQALLPSRS